MRQTRPMSAPADGRNVKVRERHEACGVRLCPAEKPRRGDRAFCRAASGRRPGHGRRAIARRHDEPAGGRARSAGRHRTAATNCVPCPRHPITWCWAPASPTRRSRMAWCPIRRAASCRSVASNLAYRAVRTRGTLGGSLALSDPAADWPTVMAALAAQVLLRGPSGRALGGCGRLRHRRLRDGAGRGRNHRKHPHPEAVSGRALGLCKILQEVGRVRQLDRRGGARPGSRLRARRARRRQRPADRSRAHVVTPPRRRWRTAASQAIVEDLQGLDFDDFQASLHAAMASRAVRQVLT